MRSRFFILVISGLLSMAQNGAAQTPQEFSAKIEASTTELYSKAALWGNIFISQYNGKQDYGELTAVRKELQEYIDEQLSEFKGEQDISGSEKLRAAVVSFYEYEKDLVKKGFLPFEALKSSSSDGEINACRERLKEESARERDLTTVLNAERRGYATKNNFPLVPPPPAPKPAPKKEESTAKPVATKPAVGTPAPGTTKAPVKKEPVKKDTDKEDDDKDEE